MISKKKMGRIITLVGLSCIAIACKNNKSETEALQKLEVASNKHYFQTEDGKPFFWLGDTGWLTFGKLSREEMDIYFQDRKQKGYNVIQVMILHSLAVKNVYGDVALVNEDVSKPLTTPGNDFKNPEEYDYWDHVDYALEAAEKNGIYLAMVPVWGTNVAKGNKVSNEQAKKYATFLRISVL